LKNFLVLFSFSIIILSAISSSAFMKKDNKRKAQFMQKFEQTYKFSVKSNNKSQLDKQFLELFEKVSKK